MFKILAGILIMSIGYEAYKTGSTWTIVDFNVTIGIALIGAGLDTIVFKRK